MKTKKMRIHDEIAERFEFIQDRGIAGDDLAALFDEIKRRVYLLESGYMAKEMLLIDAIEAGNDLFDFFADIYIDKKVSAQNVERECDALQTYLSHLMRNTMAPHSMGMQITHEDKLLRN